MEDKKEKCEHNWVMDGHNAGDSICSKCYKRPEEVCEHQWVLELNNSTNKFTGRAYCSKCHIWLTGNYIVVLDDPTLLE